MSTEVKELIEQLLEVGVTVQSREVVKRATDMLERLEKDAERYQAIRNCILPENGPFDADGFFLGGIDLDAAVDAALAAEKKGERG